MQSYPIWKYHKEKMPEGKIFHSHAEFESAGPGWVGSPADFDKEVVADFEEGKFVPSIVGDVPVGSVDGAVGSGDAGEVIPSADAKPPKAPKAPKVPKAKKVKA